MRREKRCALTPYISSFTKKEKERKKKRKGGRVGEREGEKLLQFYDEVKESWVGMGVASKNWSS